MDAMPVTTILSRMIARLFEPLRSILNSGSGITEENPDSGNSKGHEKRPSFEKDKKRRFGSGKDPKPSYAYTSRQRQDVGPSVSLFKTSNYVSYKNRIPEPVHGTCQWFFNDKRYIQWQSSDLEDVLWLTADPLCGKSVLSKALLNKNSTIDSSTTLYFFFAKDTEQHQSVASGICTLLHQLFSSYEHLFATYGMRALSLHSHTLTTDFDALWELLLGTARDTGLHEVICVLDGLDECRKDERDQLTQKLKELYRGRDQSVQPTQRANVKFFVTNRPYLDIESSFSQGNFLPSVVRIDAENRPDSISSDVELVARSHMDDIGRMMKLRPEIQEAVLSMILEKKDSTYLWQKHAFEAISEQNPGSLDEWRSVITQLPPAVELLYKDLLSQSPDVGKATKILKIVVAATRPLTLSEMDIALTMESGPATYDDLQLCGDEYIAIHVRHVCGLFVKIVDGKIHLIHSTARSYLLKQVNSVSSGWKGCLDLSECHLDIATVCVQYLLRDKLRTTSIDEESEEETYGFLIYSLSNWPAHFRESGVDETHPLADLVFKLYPRSQRWWLDQSENIPRPRAFPYKSVFDLSCYHGHDTILKRTPLKDKSRDCLSNGLRLATIAGHSSTVQLLVEARGKSNLKIDHELDVLPHMATWYGYEYIVRTLLGSGANVNSVANFGCTALHIAVLRAHANLVQALVDAGAELDAVRLGEGTALHAAADKGFAKVVEVLVQAGAKIDGYQPGHGTALHIAARNGDVKIAKLLLDAGSDANLDMPGDGLVLYVAPAAGHEKLVEALRPASYIHVPRVGFWKALTLASMRYDERTVAILLDESLAISTNLLHNIKFRRIEREDEICYRQREPSDAIDTFVGAFRTVLKRASARGKTKVVSFLLDIAEGAPVDKLGINPALRVAAANGHPEVIQELSQFRGVSVNVWGKQYGCALHAAAWGGHRDAATRLLDLGADPNAQNNDHGPPLHIAAMRGHKAVVNLLIKHAETVNVAWQDRGTALYAAAEQGHLSIVEALLEKEADVSISGGQYGNPLQAAREKGHAMVVRLLIDAELEQAAGEA